MGEMRGLRGGRELNCNGENFENRRHGTCKGKRGALAMVRNLRDEAPWHVK